MDKHSVRSIHDRGRIGIGDTESERAAVIGKSYRKCITCETNFYSVVICSEQKLRVERERQRERERGMNEGATGREKRGYWEKQD